MNTPNKLTLLRIILVPFFVAFLMISAIPYHFLWALILFIAAAVTDSIDGKLARKYNLVTNFGKFLDPLADKVLVFSALICFIELGLIGSVMVVIIMAREFLVTSLRLVAVNSGKVIAASIWGKLKTVSQMVSIVVILTLQAFIELFGIFDPSVALLVGEVLMWIATALTLISGVEYLWSNRKYINMND